MTDVPIQSVPFVSDALGGERPRTGLVRTALSGPSGQQTPEPSGSARRADSYHLGRRSP